MPAQPKAVLFPFDLPTIKWTEFDADGFSAPVCGVLYPEEKPASNGMPLGGMDTGCLDLETTGLWGYMSIFNSLAPRRGPLNTPALGLRVEGQTHVLAACGLPGVRPAKRIRYWGHYPVADIEFELDAPVSVGVRAWSPFVPGDVAASMIPGAVFEVRLRNSSDRPLDGKLALSFPGFSRHECGHQPACRTAIPAPVRGALVGIREQRLSETGPVPDFSDLRGAMRNDQPSYVLGVLDGAPARLGYHFGWNAEAWQTLGSGPDPQGVDHDNSGISVATNFSLPPGGEQVRRFVLAWYAPRWVSGHEFFHMYAARFRSAVDVATHLVEHHAALLKRILAWQQVVYSETSLPGWLRDSLINILHLITEDSVWGQARPPIGDWCRPEDGVFGLCECPRACPQIECIPCSLYGNLPVVYFFPEAALSNLRAYKAYQFEDGRPSWVFGGGFDLASPSKGYQTALNGCCLVELADKMWRRTGDDAVLHEFYDMCKRTTEFTMNLRPEYGDRQVVAMPTGNVDTEWFEAPEPGWRGMATHIGGIRLAHLLMMKRMAETVGDAEFTAKCQRWFEAGAAAMEEHLWVGNYYLNFHEPETGTKSDLVFGYQLDGQWIADFHGVGRAFPAERATTVLDTIARCNVAVSKTGAANYANPGGTPAAVGGYGAYSYFPPELLMLAMTYLYHGRREFGLDLARRCWENIICTQRLAWDQPNFFRGDVDTGERSFGNDYYQNMMLWSLPAAIAGEDLAGPCKAGGLVDRVIRAGKQGGLSRPAPQGRTAARAVGRTR